MQILVRRNRTGMHEQGVEGAFAQCGQMCLGAARREVNADVRILTQHVRKQWPREHRIGCRSESQTDRAAIALREQLCRVLQIDCLRHDSPRAFGHHDAKWRQFVTFADAVDELHPQLLFQHLNAATQGGLREMKRFGRPAE